MLPIGPNPPTISDNDRAALATAYQSLLNQRQAMIDGIAHFEDAPFRRGVIVDAIITGLMDHFHELARNQSVHTPELNAWGTSIAAYSAHFIGEIYLLLTQLPQPPKPAAETQPTVAPEATK